MRSVFESWTNVPLQSRWFSAALDVVNVCVTLNDRDTETLNLNHENQHVFYSTHFNKSHNFSEKSRFYILFSVKKSKNDGVRFFGFCTKPACSLNVLSSSDVKVHQFTGLNLIKITVWFTAVFKSQVKYLCVLQRRADRHVRSFRTKRTSL